MPEHLRGPEVDSLGPRTLSGFEIVRAQLAEYLALQRRDFSLRLALNEKRHTTVRLAPVA